MIHITTTTTKITYSDKFSITMASMTIQKVSYKMTPVARAQIIKEVKNDKKTAKSSHNNAKMKMKILATTQN